MQTGTLAAYGLPFQKQIRVNTDRALTLADLGGLILVETDGTPVSLTLPPANSVRAGGLFTIMALTGGTINAATVTPAPGDTYNGSSTSSLVLNNDGQLVNILGTNENTEWLIPLEEGGLFSTALGNIAFVGNIGGIETVIPGADTFVPIGNGNAGTHPTFVDNTSNIQFALEGTTAPTQGLLFAGLSPLRLHMAATVSVQNPALSALGFALRLLKNGNPIANTTLEGQTGGLITSAGNLTTLGSDTFAFGDVLSIEIANLTSSQNFVVSSAAINVWN